MAFSRLGFVGLLLVFACGKGSGSGDIDCGAALANRPNVYNPPPNHPDPEHVRFQRDVEVAGRTYVVESCRKEKWSQEALTCMRAAKDDKAAFEKCSALLTEKQRQAEDAATTAAFDSVKQPGQLDKKETIDGIKKLRDKICACADRACAEAVNHEWARFEGSSEGARKDSVVSDEFNKIDDEFRACLVRLAS